MEDGHEYSFMSARSFNISSCEGCMEWLRENVPGGKIVSGVAEFFFAYDKEISIEVRQG
jgi:hypothetical protein